MRDGHALHGSAGSLNEATIDGGVYGEMGGNGRWEMGKGGWGLVYCGGVLWWCTVGWVSQGGENELDVLSELFKRQFSMEEAGSVHKVPCLRLDASYGGYRCVH